MSKAVAEAFIEVSNWSASQIGVGLH